MKKTLLYAAGGGVIGALSVFGIVALTSQDWAVAIEACITAIPAGIIASFVFEPWKKG